MNNRANSPLFVKYVFKFLPLYPSFSSSPRISVIVSPKFLSFVSSPSALTLNPLLIASIIALVASNALVGVVLGLPLIALYTDVPSALTILPSAPILYVVPSTPKIFANWLPLIASVLSTDISPSLTFVILIDFFSDNPPSSSIVLITNSSPLAFETGVASSLCFVPFISDIL